MKIKANKLTLSVAAMAVTLLCARPQAAWAQVGISQLRAPDGSPNPALSVDNDGNVGIGTLSPFSKLHVAGDAYFTGRLVPAGESLTIQNAAGGGRLGLGSVGGSDRVYIAGVNGTSTASASEMIVGGLGLANLPRLSLQADTTSFSGNVGIGTATPWTKLQVVGKQSILSGWDNWLELVKTDVTPNTVWALHTPNPAGVEPTRLEFGHFNGTEWKWSRLVLTEENVGIGTHTPQAKLDVNGQIRCTTLLLTSDRNAKTNFLPVDARSVLQKVARLPLSTWHYTNAPAVRHLGPMAQDFRAAFPELGEGDKHIATVDADGVALASIQALYEIVQEKDSEIAALKRQVSDLKTELAGVKDTVSDRLVALEKAMSKSLLQQTSFRAEGVR